MTSPRRLRSSSSSSSSGPALLLLLLLPPLAAAAAAAPAPAPAPATTPPEKPAKACCAALSSPSRLEIPVLIFTLPAALPERRGQEVVGRMCQCGGPFVDNDDEGAPVPSNAARNENAADEEEEQLVELRIRGSTSARDFAKKSFNLNAAEPNETKFSLLGMPADDKYALLGAQDDRTLGSRSSLAFGAYRRGFYRWAPRTRLAEVYVRVEAQPLDYRGVYVATERVSRGKNRVDVARYDPAGDADPTGGFMLAYENDNVRPGEPTVATRMSRLALVVEYPSERVLTNASALAAKAGQKDSDPVVYLANFLDGMERALLAPGPLVERALVGKPNTTIAALPSLAPFLDAGAAADYFLLSELAKSPDAYRGSVKVSKDKSSPLVMGPPWDYGEAFGSCCGFPIEGYRQAGRSGPGLSGGSAISPQGWRFNICADPGRCAVEPADGTSQWFRRLWQDGEFRAGAAERWLAVRAGALSDAFFVAALEQEERRLASSGAAARNYARWIAELPPKAEEMIALERAGGVLGGGGGGGGVGAVAAAAPSGAAAPPPPAQFVAANLALKQWVLARLAWMDRALAAVADPQSPPDAYLKA